MLNRARNRDFQESPIVVLIDEAHQFLNKSIKDEHFDTKPLDAFDSIAKECRKYGLFLCIATQIPRDIPIGTLSQMGTFIVHQSFNFKVSPFNKHISGLKIKCFEMPNSSYMRLFGL